jgi:hypothetical protein
MAIKRFILPFVFVLLAFSAFAQKVKYKDIYTWLANKQYNEAEPFLKRYVKENDDNPNAFLYMALVFENESGRYDVLKQTSSLLYSLDSSLLFLDKAFKTITEKELKRNDEYYEMFKRRDLRTGEYGVKLSDIQFFIEKKQQELREKTDKVKLTKQYFVMSDSLYTVTQTAFSGIADKFNNNKSLLLQADQGDVEQLESISRQHSSFEKVFDLYKTSIQGLGKTGYSHELNALEIKDISSDGKSKTDFHGSKLSIWDFKKFSEATAKVIKDEIMPLRDQLVSTDIDINKLREKLETDSVSVRPEVDKLKSKIPFEDMLKFDDQPLVKNIFEIRLADLNYRSCLIEHKPHQDSTDVRLKFQLASEEKKFITVLDSIATLTTSSFIDEHAKDYTHYIKSTYNNTTILKSYVRGIQEFAGRERSTKEMTLKTALKALDWLLVGTDSVPLKVNSGDLSMYKPLHVEPEKFTTGLHYKDSITAMAYFYSITPSRKPDINVTFPIEKGVYSASTLPTAKSFVVSDPAGQMFFAIIFSENKLKDKFSMTVAKIYRSDGLAWSNSFLIDSLPVSGSFTNGEIVIQSNGGTNYMIDKNGKMR